MDDIPNALPALMKAYKIPTRCAAGGSERETRGPGGGKVYAQIDDVRDEAQQAVVDEEKLGEEIGELLFATVNLSRHLGHKAENAQQAANRTFERRFRAVEDAVHASGKTMEEATLDEMEAHCQQLKKAEAQ